MEYKKTLLTLLNERDEILSEICEREGEVDSFSQELLVGNELELQTKIEAYRDVLEEFKSRGEHYKALGEAFMKRSKAYFGADKRLRENAKNLMVNAGIESISGLSCSFKIKRNKGSVVCDETTDFQALFDAGSPYVNETKVYSPNKDAIREALDSGIDISWSKIQDGFSLDIRSVPDTKPKQLKVKNDKE